MPKKAVKKPAKAPKAAAKPEKAERRVPVDAIKHKDTRVNIPTNELRKFVKKAEDQYPVTLYPRNPELDPQLVWKGKDQQDSQPLEVPAVPIYIQEKIRPQSIIENLKKQTKERNPDNVLELFSDFNGIDSFEDKIDFYNHEGHWTNRMILGDSLLVMNSLAEKEGMKGKVQTIYMDPPYGVKFGSNWQTRTSKKDVKNGLIGDLSLEPEQIKAFRDTWSLGINSYLTYLRDRLTVSHSLLSETGSIFVQIGDENFHLVRCLLDEIFGTKNKMRDIVVAKTAGLGSDYLPASVDFVLWYAKDKDKAKVRNIFSDKISSGEETDSVYRNRDELGKVFRIDNLTSTNNNVESCLYEYKVGGKTYRPAATSQWKTTIQGMKKLEIAGRLSAGAGLYYKRYIEDFPVKPINNLWADTGSGGFVEEKFYVVQTNSKIVQRCLMLSSDPGDLVLDPTCGSGTTAAAAEQWGRRWITIDTSRVALALARTRLMAAKFPYYLLADSPEGVAKEAEAIGKVPPSIAATFDIRKGFVYRRVPHITLRAIANNPEIVPGMARKEIDQAIGRHAEYEFLFDQPYEDVKRVRVAGPFTVESLSPHRLLDAQDALSHSNQESSLATELEATDFRTQILDNLRKAGIQNTKKHERLSFDSLDPHAGAWVHAKGRYTDKDGKPKFVAVSIGPKYGTITPQHVQEAAKEAMKGSGHDLLVILGFAFGGYVPDEVKQFGELTILIVRMNPDLMMGDELLKKTGAGNLFTVFGEPDIDYATKDGMVTVNIKGVDIYDPTTGEVRSSKPDEIACWFIDTDYNDESFFVRHAYFLGDDEPYEKLKRALKAEIDEAAWSQLYSAKSRPFEKPSTGRFAVKVINHYGDEVMKVFEVK